MGDGGLGAGEEIPTSCGEGCWSAVDAGAGMAGGGGGKGSLSRSLMLLSSSASNLINPIAILGIRLP